MRKGFILLLALMGLSFVSLNRASAMPVGASEILSAHHAVAPVEKARIVCNRWGVCRRVYVRRYYYPRYYARPHYYHRHYYHRRYWY
jgi:hypothetical protein